VRSCEKFFKEIKKKKKKSKSSSSQAGGPAHKESGSKRIVYDVDSLKVLGYYKKKDE